MSYTQRDFKTKKALKDALKNNERIILMDNGMVELPTDGIVWLEGPHYPKPHTWYAKGTMVEGRIINAE